ncbi:hypothetical protein AAMO2058_000710500 [Amorphochlora amoebiformis]
MEAEKRDSFLSPSRWYKKYRCSLGSPGIPNQIFGPKAGMATLRSLQILSLSRALSKARYLFMPDIKTKKKERRFQKEGPTTYFGFSTVNLMNGVLRRSVQALFLTDPR